jgi:hypothetical protein
MGILALAADERVANVEVTDATLGVTLMDGRTIIVPLAWYPRLLNASETERNNWQIGGGGYGIHWPDIDEDLSTEGLLRGAPAPRQQLSNVNRSNEVEKRVPMTRRYIGNMNGEQYLGNTNTVEVHDLDNENTKPNGCQIDEIIKAKHDTPFKTHKEAKDAGYDNCAFCIGRSAR